MKKKPSNSQAGPERHLFDLLRQGTQALRQGQTSRALGLLEQAYQLDPENLDVALNLGGACVLSKKFRRAATILEALSERDPRNPMVWTNLGAAYLGNPVLAREEEHERAIAAFERALELDPDTPNVAYNLGLIYYDRRESDQALYWFRCALQSNPEDQDAAAYINRLTEAGDQEEEKHV